MEKKVIMPADVRVGRAPYSKIVCCRDIILISRYMSINVETCVVIKQGMHCHGMTVNRIVKNIFSAICINIGKIIKSSVHLSDSKYRLEMDRGYKVFLSLVHAAAIVFSEAWLYKGVGVVK